MSRRDPSAPGAAGGAPRVGVAALLLRAGRVLVGERLGEAQGPVWQFPGGHLRCGEGLFECAAREVWEETGLRIRCLGTGPVSNGPLAPGHHHLTVYVLAEAPQGEAQVREPGRCRAWRWHPWDDLPEPLFAPARSLRDSGFDPSRALGRGCLFVPAETRAQDPDCWS